MTGTIVSSRRFWALLALGLLLAALALAVITAVSRFPRRLSVLACLALGLIAAWFGIRRRGRPREIGLGLAVLFSAGALTLMFVEGRVLLVALAAVSFVVSLAAAGRAFLVHETLPRVRPPRHPVLIYNPLSGDGKAKRFHLEAEASRSAGRSRRRRRR